MPVWQGKIDRCCDLVCMSPRCLLELGHESGLSGGHGAPQGGSPQRHHMTNWRGARATPRVVIFLRGRPQPLRSAVIRASGKSLSTRRGKAFAITRATTGSRECSGVTSAIAPYRAVVSLGRAMWSDSSIVMNSPDVDLSLDKVDGSCVLEVDANGTSATRPAVLINHCTIRLVTLLLDCAHALGGEVPYFSHFR
jgi:hypothetical protein